MQDKTGGNIYDFYDVTQNFLAKLQETDEILVASTTFNPNFPQKHLDVDVARVKDAGLNLDDVLSTLQIYLGSLYTSNFTRHFIYQFNHIAGAVTLAVIGNYSYVRGGVHIVAGVDLRARNIGNSDIFRY